MLLLVLVFYGAKCGGIKFTNTNASEAKTKTIFNAGANSKAPVIK